MELPVIDFIQTRLLESDSTFEVREGTAHYDLFVKPQELMLQPLVNAMDQLLIAQSIRRILQLSSPDDFDSAQVDDLVANLYVFRDQGNVTTCTVRVYYTEPLDKSYPALTAEFQYNSLSYFNVNDINITAAQMALQTDGSLFYMDVLVRAQEAGSDYDADIGSINSFVNDPDAIRVTNTTAASNGKDAETNTELLQRAQRSIAVRDLETTKGINAILGENFTSITEIKSIGMGDPEMQRDVQYNIHLGGKTDVYIKTASGLTTATQDIIGLTYDTTRTVRRNVHLQMAKSETDTALNPDLGTPKIISGTVVVKDDVQETSAVLDSIAIPTGSGVDLTGKEWLRIQIDDLPVKQIRVAGATVASTQRYEIINAINYAMGYTVAIPINGDKFRLTSLKVGDGSQIVIQAIAAPVASSQNAAGPLYGLDINTDLPKTYEGIAATVYIEGYDFNVDYENGLIYQCPYDNSRSLGGTILSGQTMISSATDGQITQDSDGYILHAGTANAFLTEPLVHVRVGDIVTIEAISGASVGTLPQDFIVSEVIDAQNLRLSGFSPSGTTGVNTVTYSVVSEQVVVVDYEYNPITIDIGANVLLADGLNRGIRPSRSDYTIKNTPLIDIVSVQEIDPDTLESIGDPLAPARGYGSGGYGMGGYGSGTGGDYQFVVNDPYTRFSVFDDCMIIFKPIALGKSYRVTYRYISEILGIHNFCRTDDERVTGADVLPKSFVPALADMTINIRRDATSTSTPDDAGLTTLVANFVEKTLAESGIKESDIIELLENQGVDSVQTPFTMTATVLHTNGMTTFLENQDILIYPDVTLPSQTEDYVTKRITHFFANNIVVQEVT